MNMKSMHQKTSPKRLLFLDFDGVINSAMYIFSLGVASEAEQWFLFLEHPERMIDPDALKRIRYICDELQMKIVVSSTWRYKYNEADFIKMFAHHGWADAPIIGVTQNLKSVGCIRGDEIKLWVDQHGFDGDYFILDDLGRENFLPQQVVFQTQYETGFVDEHIPEFLAIINSGKSGANQAKGLKDK